jgi:hypothetical protein
LLLFPDEFPKKDNMFILLILHKFFFYCSG